MEFREEELRRQREIVAAHLRWLDQEIARGQPAAPAKALAPQSPAPPIAPPPQPSFASRPTEVTPSAQARVLPELAVPELDSGSIRNDVRRGCMIYVVIVSVLIAASLGLALWLAGE